MDDDSPVFNVCVVWSTMRPSDWLKLRPSVCAEFVVSCSDGRNCCFRDVTTVVLSDAAFSDCLRTLFWRSAMPMA